jgi:hypothetical protein
MDAAYTEYKRVEYAARTTGKYQADLKVAADRFNAAKAAYAAAQRAPAAPTAPAVPVNADGTTGPQPYTDSTAQGPGAPTVRGTTGERRGDYVWDDESGWVYTAGSSGGTPINSAELAASEKAREILRSLLRQFDFDQGEINALMVDAENYIKRGFAPNLIPTLLTESATYKARFAGNEARRAKGLRVLSPAEYLSQEQGYRQALRSYGMPDGFWDQRDDFKRFIENDLSAKELADRLDVGAQFLDSADPTYKKVFRDYHGLNDGAAIAAALDPDRALPILQKMSRAAKLGTAAKRAGFDTGLDRANQLDDAGITADQAQQGYQAAAEILPDQQAIATRFGETYGIADAEDEFLLGQAGARKKRRDLNQKEAGLFSGSGGVDPRSSLKRDTGGSY